MRALFENVIAALDRLFDRKSKVVDLYALVVATSVALRGSRFAAVAELPIVELEKVVRSGESEVGQRDLALWVTDELRLFVAQELDGDEEGNLR
jgi:hypothetical protein